MESLQDTQEKSFLNIILNFIFFNLDKNNFKNMQFANGYMPTQQEQIETNLTPPNYYQYTQKQAQNLSYLKTDINATSHSMSNLHNHNASNVLLQRVPRRRWNVAPVSQNEVLTQINFYQPQQNYSPPNIPLSNVNKLEPKLVENTTNNFLHQNFAQQNQFQYPEAVYMSPTISASVSLNALRSATLDSNNFNNKSPLQNNQTNNRKNSGIYYPASHFSKNNSPSVNLTPLNNNESFVRKSSARNSFSKRYLKNIEVLIIKIKFYLLYFFKGKNSLEAWQYGN